MATTEATKAIVKAIEAARDARGLSQSEIARRTGISQQAISRALSGNQRLYADQLIAICEAIEVPLDWLARYATDPAPSPESFKLRSEIERIISTAGLEESYRRLVVAAPCELSPTHGRTIATVDEREAMRPRYRGQSKGRQARTKGPKPRTDQEGSDESSDASQSARDIQR